MSKRPSSGKASTPEGAPPSRIRIVSARVSIPASPGSPCARSQAGSGWRARQFEGSVTSWRTISPRAAGVAASMSSRVGADIADMGEGEGDDLPGVGGIGQRLLVAGHAGVEADLSHRLGRAVRAESPSPEDAPVREHERGRRPRRRLGAVGHARPGRRGRRARKIGEREARGADQPRPVPRGNGARLAPFAHRFGADAGERSCRLEPAEALDDVVDRDGHGRDIGEIFSTRKPGLEGGKFFPGRSAGARAGTL